MGQNSLKKYTRELVGNVPLRPWGAGLGMFLLVISSLPEVAAQTVGDQFADRVLLSGATGLASADTSEASSEAGEPRHDSDDPKRSVWFRWQAPSDGTVTFYTAVSDFDPRMAAYTGDAIASLSEITSNDDSNGTESALSFAVTEGVEYQIAIDIVGPFPGVTNLVWWLQSSEAPPTNDRFSDRLPVSGDSGNTVVSSLLATSESGDPDLGLSDGDTGKTVWWTWTPEKTGTAALQTSFSDFDTVLGVYRGAGLDSLTQLATDDDGGPGSTSFLIVNVTGGESIEIAVGGFGGTGGTVVLLWNMITEACKDPEPVASPNPAQDEIIVDLQPVLTWGHLETKRRKVIYGNDDREDAFEVEDPDLLAVIDSTVALVFRGDLKKNPDGTYRLPSATLAQGDHDPALCTDDPFRDQPVPAQCSGFLVGKDLVATAGHCLKVEDCDNHAFVFGFQMIDENTPVTSFDESQIYYCSEVVATVLDDHGPDWSLARLDREVTDHVPLRLRRTGKVPDNQSLLVAGHPLGLPLKVAGGANVRTNSEDTFFDANIDSFGGNSGSAVFNTDTWVVEGILVRGDDDFETDEQRGCTTSKRCPDSGCTGEDVTRSTVFAPFVPAHPATRLYKIFFGPCGNMTEVDSVTSPQWSPVDTLTPDIDYCWQVVTLDECGSSTGPEWRFSTRTGTLFKRADINSDDLSDITDVLNLLKFMFLGQPLGVDCQKAGDFDDNGQFDTTDAVSLLKFLFLGDNAPPAPFGSCGVDATPDDLTCNSYPKCE